jgi:hypothetical protein
MDLPDNSVIISGLDNWHYTGSQNAAIDEPRLIAKVRARLDNPSLTLRKPPSEQTDPYGPKSGITAWEFPQWFLVQDPIKTIEGTQRRLVHQSRLSNGKFKDAGKTYEVVPIRFVRACEHGHVDDIHWSGFTHHYGKSCAGQLYIEEVGTTGEISNIRIRCACGESRSLHQAAQKGTKSLGKCTGRRPWLGNFSEEPCDCWSRLLIRSASNAYFPQILSVISIPDNRTELDEAISSLWEAHFSAVTNAQELAYERKKPPVQAAVSKYSNEDILASIERIRSGIKKAAETPVKDAEYEVFNDSKTELGANVPDGNFYARTLPPEKWQTPPQNGKTSSMAAVEKVVLVHRMREVVALLGFTRFESLGTDFNGELPDELNLPVKPGTLSINPTWLPAIESRGEGIFIAIKSLAVEQWANQPIVLSRGKILLEGFTQWQKSHANQTRKFPGIQYYMLHTLSHNLMTAITLDCGYPASSIRERIYCTPGTPEKPGHYAVLLHTSSNDAEGTLGGLVEAGRRIQYFFQRALELAQLCSNDPVCAHHIPGTHDPSPLLGAACHGCMLIPETSCEQRNDFLDRSLLTPTLEQTGVEFFANHHA